MPRDLDVEEVFDTATWSQFFFSLQSRAPVLAIIRRALKPGGYLGMPLLGEPPVSPEALRRPSGWSITAAHSVQQLGYYSAERAELRAERKRPASISSAGTGSSCPCDVGAPAHLTGLGRGAPGACKDRPRGEAPWRLEQGDAASCLADWRGLVLRCLPCWP